jgi:phospholipid-binding lipoprotein MlaA
MLFGGCARLPVAEGLPSYPDAFGPPEDRSAAETRAEKEIPPEFLDESLDFLEEEELGPPPAEIADPLEPWNQIVFRFNDRLYFWVLKPTATFYRDTVPSPVRNGFANFFHNLLTPVRFTACVLQAKGRSAALELSRFMINSTFGLLGFLDLTRKYPETIPPEEDLGQALGSYGIGQGFYIVWPLLGPSTLRDSIGLVGDSFLNPVTYVRPTASAAGIKGFRTINNTSFRIGDYEGMKAAAIEPYISIRDGYIQMRKAQTAQ